MVSFEASPAEVFFWTGCVLGLVTKYVDPVILSYAAFLGSCNLLGVCICKAFVETCCYAVGTLCGRVDTDRVHELSAIDSDNLTVLLAGLTHDARTHVLRSVSVRIAKH